jgi:hypothetical protein
MSSSSMLSSPNFLRNVLRVDALSCIACGALQVAFPAAMARLLNLPEGLIAYTGEFLLVYAAVVAFVSTRNPLPRGVIWALVAGNIGWALACMLLLVSGACVAFHAGRGLRSGAGADGGGAGRVAVLRPAPRGAPAGLVTTHQTGHKTGRGGRVCGARLPRPRSACQNGGCCQ